MRISGISLFVLVFINIGWAQFPAALFSFDEDPYTVCRGEVIEPENNSIGASEFLWDFCPETFLETPITNASVPVTGLSNGWAYKVVKSGNEWFGFLVSRNTNKLFRLEFGNNPSSNPTIYDLGNPGNLLISPQGIDIVYHNGNWELFLGKGETTTGQIVRLNFANDLKSIPTAVGLGTFGIAGRLRDVKIVKQGSDVILLIINDGGNSIRRINYRDSFDNTISAEHITSTGALIGANLPLGFSVVKVNGNWVVLTVSFSNNGIQHYNFGTDILNSPTYIGNYTFSTVIKPYYIKVMQEGSDYFAFVANENSKLSIINFYDLSGSSAPSELLNTNLQKLIGFDVLKYQSKNIIQGTITATANFTQIWFENSGCTVSKSWDESESPENVFWNTNGEGIIELEVVGIDYLIDVDAKEITISDAQAPLVEILNVNSCVSSEITFSTNSNQPLTQWAWNFGDSSTETISSPSHQYVAPAEYQVTVRVTDINSCEVTAIRQLSIYNAPIADFTLPNVIPICTNQEYVLENISAYDLGSLPIWKWKVNGMDITADEDMNFAFTSLGNQDISLTASIPGCESEIVKSITTLQEGPVVDFSFAGQCEDADVLFTNNSSGSITGYSWNFDDGQSSSDVSPNHSFSNIGSFDVTLTASNAAGCNNIVSKQVIVYSKPQINFAAALPPFSCNGTPTMFNDLTPNPVDSNIASWLWNFGDSGSGQNTSTLKNPQHTYNTAGNYDVSLTVSTNFLCSSTLQLPVTISQAPVADFNFTPPCEDVVTNFTDNSMGAIQSWDWQIGSTFYFTQNPVHTFSNPGNTNATLNVTAVNSCIGSIIKSITIPAKLIPDFSVSKNCKEQQTLFTDITNASADPVSAYAWDFDGLGTSVGSPTNFTFFSTGIKNITLLLSTQAGCEYFVTKPIDIGTPPLANFNASPEMGPGPLEVQFTNTSAEAISFVWNFNDSENTSSTEPSPIFTFHEPGEYDVRLVAFNSASCTDTIFHRIMVVPITDTEEDLNFYFKAPYPNPTKGNIVLGWNANRSEIYSISVFDMFGRQILESNYSSVEGANETALNLNGIASGVYFLQTRLGGRKKTFRILVNPE